MIEAVEFRTLHNSKNFDALLTEYAEEAALSALPIPKPQPDMYYSMERAGILHCLASYTDDRTLSGFMTLIVTVMPHYGAIIATSESYFVGSAYRQSGAGIRLLKAAEAISAGVGAVGLLVSAPVGGKLENVLPKAGYANTNRLFFKAVA
jgi:hypothetical protein